MENSKLFRMLKALSAVEFNDFGKFVRSQYFNQSGKLIKLYSFLKSFHPHFESRELNRYKLFEAMYPGEKYNDKKLRDRLSLMIRLAERHAAYLEFRKDAFEHKLYLAKNQSRKNLDVSFEDTIENLTQFLEKSKVRDEDYYLKKYFIEKLRREHKESKTQAGKMQPVYDNLMMENSNLFIFTLVTFLMNYLKMKDAEGLIKISEESKIYENFIDYIGILYDYFDYVPAVQILYKFLRLLGRNPEDSSTYFDLKSLLDKSPGIFKTDDRRLLYSLLYDYCKDIQEKGKKDFGAAAFEITKEMIASDLLMENDGYMHQHNYINFAATAMRENEIKWAEDFINNNKDRIRYEFRENAFNYSSADLNYIRGRRDRANSEKYFKTALEHLSKVKKEDFYYYARIKNMKIKIYYELEELNKCLDLISSYRKSFNRNDLIPEHLKDRYFSFINFTQKLISLNDRLKNLDNKKICGEKEILRNEISESSAEFKKWLIEKVEEMR